MHIRTAPKRAILALAVACSLPIPLFAPVVASAQAGSDGYGPEDLTNFEIPENLFEGTWVDPVTRFDLDETTLATLDDFDITSIHDSRVFAAGVELQQVANDTTTELADRHIRVLRVIETLEREVDSIESQIREREPEINTLLTGIRVAEENTARLAEEIDVRERAIAEFAIRTFIGEDQVELVLTEPDTEFGETRVVSDEVRDDHRTQIATRERYLARHVETHARLTSDLETIRDELQSLRSARVERIADQEEAEALAEQTEDTYQLALHSRLAEFVDGTDIPFVALNAYVIAARTLEIEDPQCQIHWSMLAGIGRIESFHGYFGNSTLDINGHTTEDIRGLPLDGRILSGAEFVTGDDAPAASGRTEDTVVTIPASPADVAQSSNETLTGAFQADGDTGETAEPAPEPAPTSTLEPLIPAPEPEPTPSPGSAAGAASTVEEVPTTPETPGDKAGDANPADAESATTTAGGATTTGVVKTLALILDSDDGVLDGDTVYDRAVGPMQFIPTTWRLFDADGNGDGETDPQNIYDAALASARYLCASTTTMATLAGEQRAYFAYNHDLDYSRNVTQAGRGYRNLISIESPEIGEGEARYYRGILEGSQADAVEDVDDEDAPLVDIAQLRADLAAITLPDW